MPEALLYNVWHPKLRRLYQYWDGRRGVRLMPARADVASIDIPELLSNILLINVQHAPLGFTDRLVGTGIVALLGRDTTGEDPDRSLPAAFRETMPQLWRDCVQTRMPARGDFEVEIYGHKRPFECLVLPLSDDGETVNMLLASVWQRREGGRSREMRASGNRPRLRLVVGGSV